MKTWVLPFSLPKRLGVQDPVAVALKRRAQTAIVLVGRSRPRVSYERTASGESQRLFVLADLRLEGVRHSFRRAQA